MASSSIAFALTSCSLGRTSSPSLPTISVSRSFRDLHHHHHHRINQNLSIKAQIFDFPGRFFEGEFGDEDEPPNLLDSSLMEDEDEEEEEEEEELQCPPGLRKYETMMVLKPDMSEDERLSLTQKYEELLVAGGAMYVEVFNRGVNPLSYIIKKKNRGGETNTFLDGIYLLFTYFTKPESMQDLEQTLQTDYDVIRSSTFKIRNRKY